jgi:hypothetical protein
MTITNVKLAAMRRRARPYLAAKGFRKPHVDAAFNALTTAFDNNKTALSNAVDNATSAVDGEGLTFSNQDKRAIFLAWLYYEFERQLAILQEGE